MTLLAVFGNPIGHSRSPAIHRAFAEQFDISLHYEKVLVQEGLFTETVREFCARVGPGLMSLCLVRPRHLIWLTIMIRLP